jgi:hypothetical protein
MISEEEKKIIRAKLADEEYTFYLQNLTIFRVVDMKSWIVKVYDAIEDSLDDVYNNLDDKNKYHIDGDIIKSNYEDDDCKFELTIELFEEEK